MMSKDGLLGRWRVERDIRDAHAKQTGRFEGHAVFTTDADALVYTEAGTLRLGGGPPFEATRRYIWQFVEGEILVHFDDGRFFHSFDPTDGAQARHLCGDDLYDVTYTCAHWPEWQAQWAVSGPRKSYVMTSRYSR